MNLIFVVGVKIQKNSITGAADFIKFRERVFNMLIPGRVLINTNAEISDFSFLKYGRSIYKKGGSGGGEFAFYQVNLASKY